MHSTPTHDAPEVVGNTTDYVAETKGKTFWAGGNFLDVSVQSEASVDGDNGTLGPNEYSLQLNTNAYGRTSACDGRAVVYHNTGAGWGVARDSVLDISSVWDKTEFGIFGDGGCSQAQFGFGTSFTQLLQVNDGSGAMPKCLKNDGTTGEA
jgi:hypothetical protein